MSEKTNKTKRNSWIVAIIASSISVFDMTVSNFFEAWIHGDLFENSNEHNPSILVTSEELGVDDLEWSRNGTE